jgi:hypothetical protein
VSFDGCLGATYGLTVTVFVRYHLPSSSQSFSTLFDTSQQVYVHASASGEEAWGSIYLKTVVQGVLMAR